MTSYLQQSFGFKVKKVARYVRLYGVSRTLVKVRAQYHAVRTDSFEGDEWVNPNCRSSADPGRAVGIIGCGNFAYSVIAHYLKQEKPRFLRGACDISAARAKSLCRDYSGVYATTLADKIANDPLIKLVFIASNHASHAEYAIQCIDAGKSVHIEKPHVISEDQLRRLNAAQARHPEALVFLGFNRTRSEHFQRLLLAVSEQQGATMINWFVVGHDIPDDHWYFNAEEGGRVLGNLCHWTDASFQIVGPENLFPCQIIPSCVPGAKSDFCVALVCNDGSIAAITFSAKGHTFEGIRETLNLHRGDLIARIDDFGASTFEALGRKSRWSSYFRDHGHRSNVVNSYRAALGADRDRATSIDYANATAVLFLAAQKAITERVPIEVNLRDLTQWRSERSMASAAIDPSGTNAPAYD